MTGLGVTTRKLGCCRHVSNDISQPFHPHDGTRRGTGDESVGAAVIPVDDMTSLTLGVWPLPMAEKIVDECPVYRQQPANVHLEC